MVVDCHQVACVVCVVTESKILKKKKKSPNFIWDRGKISATEKKKPVSPPPRP